MPRTVSSRPQVCQIIKPTGNSSGAWQGIETAQPFKKLTVEGLRSSKRFTVSYAPSRSVPGAMLSIGGATIGTVGAIMASTPATAAKTTCCSVWRARRMAR